MTANLESLDELRTRVERQQIELDTAMRGLCEAARRSLTPARWIGGHPEIWLTSALVAGFWFGTRRRSSRRRGWR